MAIQTQNLPTTSAASLHSRTGSAGSRTQKDTGFPEPLSPDRNTTLPHPDADTSPNPTIEASDIELERTRSRRSFLKRHQSSKSGTIPLEERGPFPQRDAMYDGIVYADGSREQKSPTAIERDAERRGNIAAAPTKEEVEGEEDTAAVVGPEKRVQRLSESSGSSSDDILKQKIAGAGGKTGRRRSILRKMGLHK